MIHCRYFQGKTLNVEGNKMPKLNLKCTSRFTGLFNLDIVRMVSRINIDGITFSSACGQISLKALYIKAI